MLTAGAVDRPVAALEIGARQGPLADDVAGLGGALNPLPVRLGVGASQHPFVIGAGQPPHGADVALIGPGAVLRHDLRAIAIRLRVLSAIVIQLSQLLLGLKAPSSCGFAPVCLRLGDIALIGEQGADLVLGTLFAICAGVLQQLQRPIRLINDQQPAQVERGIGFAGARLRVGRLEQPDRLGPVFLAALAEGQHTRVFDLSGRVPAAGGGREKLGAALGITFLDGGASGGELSLIARRQAIRVMTLDASGQSQGKDQGA